MITITRRDEKRPTLITMIIMKMMMILPTTTKRIRRFTIFMSLIMVVLIMMTGIILRYYNIIVVISSGGGEEKEEKAITTTSKSQSSLSMLLLPPPLPNNSTYKYCKKSTMDQNLLKLQSMLYNNPQFYGLRDVDVDVTTTIDEDNEDNEESTEESSSTTTKITIPGLTPDLIQHAFGGGSNYAQQLQRKSIAFVGDSTLRYLTHSLCNLLMQQQPQEHSSSNNTNNTSLVLLLSNQTLSDGHQMIHPGQYYSNPKKPMNIQRPPYIDSDSSHTKCRKQISSSSYSSSGNNDNNIRWIGYSGIGEHCKFDIFFNELHIIQPSVIIVNMGLHWLHFEQQGRDAPLCAVRRWINYEEFLQQVLDNLPSNSTKLVLFKTTNYVCDSKYQGQFSVANQAYSSIVASSSSAAGDNKNNDVMYKCQQSIMNKVDTALASSSSSDSTITKRDVERYCKYGTFNEIGSSYLNERLRKFVFEKQQQQKQKQKQKQSSNSNSNNDQAKVIKIGIYNDHDLESCEYTNFGDGRHYRLLNLLRIRYLANILACM